jgi:hypothetical protein
LGLKLLMPIYFVDIVNNNDYKTRNEKKKYCDKVIPVTASKRGLSKQFFRLFLHVNVTTGVLGESSSSCPEFIFNLLAPKFGI